MDRPRRTPKRRLFPDSELVKPPMKLSRLETKKLENAKYKDKLMSDPLRYAEYKANDAVRKREERKKMTEEAKAVAREKTRLRNIAYRERRKAKKASKVSLSTPTPRNTRAGVKKFAEQREKNRLSQLKRRSDMHPQKKRREREKNRLYYHARQHTSTPTCITKPCAQSTPNPSPLHLAPDLSVSIDQSVSNALASLTPATPQILAAGGIDPSALITAQSVSLPPTALGTAPPVSLPPSARGTAPPVSLPASALGMAPPVSLPPSALGKAPPVSLPSTALNAAPSASVAPTTSHIPTKKVSRSTLYRMAKKFKDKSPIVMKGLIKNFDKKNSKTLADCGISYTSPSKEVSQNEKSLKTNIPGNKRDKKTLTAKRALKGVMTSSYKRSMKNGKHGQLIQDFYERKAIYVPGKKVVGSDLVSKKTLDKSIVNVHKDFVQENGPLISRATFFRYRPKNVLSFTKTPFRQCLCEICLNPMLKVKVLNKLLGFSTNVSVSSLKQLIALTLCEGEAFQCLERMCNSCGVSGIERWVECLNTNDRETLLSWQKWEKVCKNGSNRIDIVKKQGNVCDIVSELKADVVRLPMHDFVHHWQSAQYRQICNDMPQGWAVITLDFAENYLCKQQDQPQSAYFGYTQVTVHPCVIYRWCPCGIRKTENWTFLFNNLSYNADMVNTIVRRILHHLQCLGMKKIIIFSDGCSSQYKSKLPFHHLFSYAFDYNFVVERCFFGARHGKNPCDALGGVLKQTASRAVKARKYTIQNAEDLHKFASENLTVHAADCRQHMSRDFFVLRDEDLLTCDEVHLL